jgi:hypothetical protein
MLTFRLPSTFVTKADLTPGFVESSQGEIHSQLFSLKLLMVKLLPTLEVDLLVPAAWSTLTVVVVAAIPVFLLATEDTNSRFLEKL